MANLNMGKLVLLFLHIDPSHIGKDVTLFPLYIGRAMHYDVEIVSLRSEANLNFPAFVDGIHYKFITCGFKASSSVKNLYMLWYLARNAWKINVLMCFHYNMETMYRVILYKILNHKGKVYVKCDIDSKEISDRFSLVNDGFRNKLRRYVYRRGISGIEVVSCETSQAFSIMSASASPLLAFNQGQLVLSPNGFDDQRLLKYGLVPATFSKKENIMITVGRLGSYQKNTEMLFKALSRVRLDEIGKEGWKFYLIGPVEPDFGIEITRFFENHPEKKESVIFTGPIYDKKILWEYYNRAKVFVLTSRYESAGIVLNEAKRFGCYLISTDVGAARDAIDGRFGSLIGQENSVELAHVLNGIVSGEVNADVYKNFDFSVLSMDYCIKPIVRRLKSAVQETKNMKRPC